MAELKPCRCGAMPVLEEKAEMLGKVWDGGYSIPVGRYFCPVCGKAQGWGTAYSTFTDLGRENNIRVWNRLIGESDG